VSFTEAELTRYYPRLFHMAEAGSWPLIREHGLLSTKGLLDLFEWKGEPRRLLESAHRPDSVTIQHVKHGTAVIRDQKPMRERSLKTCLIGMGPEEWYELLNGFVFFWLTRERAEQLLMARAYRNSTHSVITVDTATLLAKYASKVRLSPINSGSTIYKPRPRGFATFRIITDYPFDERKKLRGKANAVAELAVEYGVPDIYKFVLSVEHRRRDKLVERIYESRI
jgi:hypothetical protein